MGSVLPHEEKSTSQVIIVGKATLTEENAPCISRNVDDASSDVSTSANSSRCTSPANPSRPGTPSWLKPSWPRPNKLQMLDVGDSTPRLKTVNGQFVPVRMSSPGRRLPSLKSSP